MAVKATASHTKERPRAQIKDLVPELTITLSSGIATLAVGMGALLAIILIAVLGLSPDNTIVWIATASMVLAVAATAHLTLFVALRPLRIISNTLAQKVGEAVASKSVPPPTSTVYSRNTSLGSALDAIQTLAATAATPRTNDVNASDASLPGALDRLHGAIIVLDENKKVTFSTKGAPLHGAADSLTPQLLFADSDTIENWLDNIEHSAVRAEKIWRRIPDKPADQEGQRLFDIYASFERGSRQPVVVTLVDQTELYHQDEEDLTFIAFAAHELRGPITVIRGYLDVLQDELGGKIEQDQQELFYRLIVSANRLSSYINNILNTSRYDRRHLTLTLNEDSLAAIYETIADDMAMRASSQNRFLSITIPQNLPTVAADRSSLGEVLGNLIDNAIKYSSEGGSVAVTAEQKGDTVEVSVADHGIGMPANVVKNLFQKFYRSHRSRETVAGSGIGLYISKAIIESHGGSIAVRSVEGQGSVFTISLPTYASVADKLAATSHSNQAFITQGGGWIKNHAMYRG